MVFECCEEILGGNLNYIDLGYLLCSLYFFFFWVIGYEGKLVLLLKD